MEERYRYRQTVSPNPTLGRDRDSPAAGTIEIVTPYDGHQYLTREAVADVERRLAASGSAPQADVEALIGHLVVVGHQDTDLADRMGLQGRFGAHGIRIPVRSPTLTSERDLVADRWKHRLAVDYTPSPTKPKLTPIRLVVRLSDPDNVSAHEDLVRTLSAAEKERVGSEAEVIKRFVGFRPHLLLTIKALLTLPPGAGDAKPVVRRVTVGLPETLSLSESSLRLRVGGLDHDFQYDPTCNLLEFFDVPCREAEADASSSTEPDEQVPRRRSSVEMAVHFEQPGRLFAQDKLLVTADVEVPGELLSGTRARLFDARGYRYRDDGPLKVRSLITTNCEVGLGYAFGRRVVSPYQSFHFGEIVPDELRIADIRAALGDQRFIVDVADKVASGERKNEMVRHVLMAHRADGPDVIRLLIVVEGRRQRTRREVRGPAGRNTSKFTSGDLWLFVRGEAPRDARTVVHEINKLQRSLRDRFRRLRVPR
jgi:hypothetical protein